MRTTVNIARIITGLLFIFSGLVKAIDPLGLAYKMQEFFEAWAADGFFKSLMQIFNEHALAFSVVMITLEVAVGLALLIGWCKKLTSLILVALMVFFTFLTSYVLFSGKIRACGCFGDCIPLTPIQTFTKDIVLLILALLLFFKREYIRPLVKPVVNSSLLLAGIILVVILQLYVLKHLPLRDCLPYKVGNNILELRKMPPDAVAAKYDYKFIYEKDGQKKTYDAANLPDSSWKFVERSQVLVAAGKNNVPLINDFSLADSSGTDRTSDILGTREKYYLFFIKDVPGHIDVNWIKDLKTFINSEKTSSKIYFVTAQRDETSDFLKANGIIADAIFTTDGTAIKTAARVNPTVFEMHGPVVQAKTSWTDFRKAY